MRPIARTAAFAFAALAVALPLEAQSTDFTWRGRLAAGRQIEIKSVNGEISALPADGDEIVVTANKRARRDDPEEVRIEVVEHADGVTICAVYPTPRRARRPNECGPGEGGQMSVQNNDVKVDFTVRVPARVRLAARTVNGDVDIDGLGSHVEARTVNGSIRLATRGYASASTVNGSINASLGTASWNDDLEFETVNGGITIDVPANLNADVRFSTVNGSVETDFPISVQGRFNSRRMSGTIGNGGRGLRANTVNGSIRLRKTG